MKVKFDWQFDEDQVGMPWQDTAEPENPRGMRELAQGYSKLVRDAVPTARSVYEAGLTRSQRRLYAALARIYPWLSPIAQPESPSPSYNWRNFSLRIARLATGVSLRLASLFMRVGVRLGYRPHKVRLTAHQRRLHAALAQTRPWLCPEAQREPFARH